mmetsp:Transcript_37209/g.81220  ORF Transcript_37209/g.81220 Transcript_37209/m.81220 type:complete len:342 (+) Transcript_37209:65-1090(+)
MARNGAMAAAAIALGLAAATFLVASSAFVQGPAARSEPPRAQTGTFLGYSAAPEGPVAALQEQTPAAQGSWSWAAPLLGLGATLGLLVGIWQPAPARAITAEQFSQLTYQQVRGSGLANRCPTVESQGTEIKVQQGQRLRGVCFEPKSFQVETEIDGKPTFVSTKLMTRQTYTLDFIEGTLNPNPITFVEEDGMDFAATTVQLPDGERVPFMFTVKQLVAKGEGSKFKPGFTWGGEFEVPSYRSGGFLDPKGRGMYTGYDQAVGLPASQADGGEGQDAIFKETNKVFDIGRGAIEMEVNKVNQDLGEIGGVFVSKQPGDTDMGAKAPKTILLKGIFYAKVV